MTHGYIIHDQGAMYFLTFQVIDWVDIFTRPVYKDIITESFFFCRKNKGLLIFGYVIMTNHIHLIARARNQNLSEVVRDFKKFTSAKLVEAIKREEESRREWMLSRFQNAAATNARSKNYQLWTHENHAMELRSPEFVRQKINYIHENPVRAGWVEKQEDYLYSSARNYAGLPYVLEIDFL